MAASSKPLVIPSQAALVAAGPPPITVRAVSDLAKQLQLLDAEILVQEQLLAVMKSRRWKMATETIPTALDEAQVKSLTLPDGTRVEVEEFIAANIKVEDRPKAFAWLRANKAGAIIKNKFEVKLGKGEDALAKKLAAACKKLGIPIARKEEVNYQTLQAFVKEKLRAGKALPPEINVTKVPTATIIPPKEKE